MRMRTLNVRRKKWKRRKNLTRIKSKSNKCNFPYKFLHPWPHLCHCVNDRNLSIIFTLQKLSKVNDWSKKVLNWVKRKLNQNFGSSSRQSIQSFGWMTQNTVTSNWMMEPNWRGKIKSFFKCNLYFRVRLLWNFGEMNFFWILARNYLKRDKKIVSISLNETILLLPDICKNTISNISSQICWAILSKINSFVF